MNIWLRGRTLTGQETGAITDVLSGQSKWSRIWWLMETSRCSLLRLVLQASLHVTIKRPAILLSLDQAYQCYDLSLEA